MFSNFTAAEVVMIITALGGLATLVAAGIVTVIVAIRKVDKVIEKVEETSATVGKVEGHVNSARTEAATKIDALQAQIGGMHLEMAKREQIAALLAQTKISNGIAAKASHDAPIPVIVENPPSDPVPTTKGAATK